MTFQEYSECQIQIIKVLKQKYTNLGAEEAIILASLILEKIIITLNLKTEIK